MKRSTVLIVSDDESFRHSLERAWKAAKLPAFTTADSSLAPTSDGCALAVIGPVHNDRLQPVLKALESAERSVLCFIPASPARSPLRSQFPAVRFLHFDEDCADLAVILVDEILRRMDVTARLREAEQARVDGQRDATMGQSIRDMRHDINNALTAVLGNAELLLLDGDAMTPQAREQAETIRAHALHMHEIMRQLSSVEAEAKAGTRARAVRK